MKIAMVFDGIGVGGIERVGIDYTKILTDRHVKIDIFNISPGYTAMEKELPDTVRVTHMKFPRSISPYRYAMLKKRFWWGKLAYPPIFVIVWICSKIYGLRLKKSKEEYDVAIAFSGHYNDLTFVADKKIRYKKSICWLHGGMADYEAISDGYVKLYKKFDGMIVLSERGDEGALKRNRALLALKRKKIYNPTFIMDRTVNEEITRELRSKYGEYLLMIGRFSNEKDHGMIVRVLKILHEVFDRRVHLVFVGDGPQKEEVERFTKELGMWKYVHFEGSCFDVQNYYASAHIYVHASPAEGLPTVLIEAMCFGVPIVATDSRPGVPEVLEDGACGLICPYGDDEDMAKKLDTLLRDVELYKHIQRAERERARCFSADRIGTQLENMLNEITGSRE